MNQNLKNNSHSIKITAQMPNRQNFVTSKTERLKETRIVVKKNNRTTHKINTRNIQLQLTFPRNRRKYTQEP